VRASEWVLVSLLAWAVAAYLIVPRLWKLYFHYHPVVEVARVTQTSDRHPGDPVNIVLVGSDAEVVQGMTAAGWFPADPITFRSSARIAADSILRRPDDDAPVSNLFLFGRKQDLAFEQPVSGGPRQRHHVRFWRWDKLYEGRPAWIGAATFDGEPGVEAVVPLD
jgi:LssY C-terminus